MAKARRTVSAKGVIESAASGMKVSVTLMKKKGSKYVKVTTKSVTVKALADRDGDSLSDAVFLAGFKRPRRGAYAFVARYAGNATFLASTKTATFKL